MACYEEINTSPSDDGDRDGLPNDTTSTSDSSVPEGPLTSGIFITEGEHAEEQLSFMKEMATTYRLMRDNAAPTE